MAPQTVLVTGAGGFIGKHLVLALGREARFVVQQVTRATSAAELKRLLQSAEVVCHLAGVNRAADEAAFQTGNAGFTAELCRILASSGRKPLFIYASSIQSDLPNAYGRSKRAGEARVADWAASTGARSAILRLKNVFGMWCRPEYNSVVATFCHKLARGEPIHVHQPDRRIELVFVEDVIAQILELISNPPAAGSAVFYASPSGEEITLQQLARMIEEFAGSRHTLELPRLDGRFARALYATYLSCLEEANFAYALQQRRDARGVLAEFIKQPGFGQIFVSRTLPGVSRGNHYHLCKTEKFLVLQGEAIVRFKIVHGSGSVIEYRVRGEDLRVIDIPPGYAHSITNCGSSELVTLFWACEVFDPNRPDTVAYPVQD